jgi:glycerol transport system ATP-binding protein
VGRETHLADVTLRFERGTFNTLLGPRLSGKTSMLRIMGGLDAPTGGSVWFDGREVTGENVRKRNIAFVYRDQVNYPSLSVRENIASPLKVRREKRAVIEAEVGRVAGLLGLSGLLEKRPRELPPEDRQRVALARAMARKADLVLLDEPLAHLDVAQREEMRLLLPALFADTNAVVVYATTDPAEALILGGETAALHEGRIAQIGPAGGLYRTPKDLTAAQIMSDPPLNVLRVVSRDWKTTPRDDVAPPCRLPLLADGTWTFAWRAHHLALGAGSPRALSFPLRVVSTEITGSETYVHVAFGAERWVMLLPGVRSFEPDSVVEGHVEPELAMVFDARDRTFEGAMREAA